MKKLLIGLTSIFLCLSGISCSSEADSEASISLTQQGNDEKTSSETINNYSVNNTSLKQNENVPFSRDDLKFDSNTKIMKAYVDSGTGNNGLHNYSMSQFGMAENCYGTEVDVYGNQYLRNVGINWFEKPKNASAMEFYWFYYTPKNELFVRFRHYNYKEKIDNYETLKRIIATDSHIDSTKENRLKIRMTDSNKVEFYANGFLVYSEDVKLSTFGNMLLTYQTVNGQSYTKEKPAYAYWKFRTEQVKK